MGDSSKLRMMEIDILIYYLCVYSMPPCSIFLNAETVFLSFELN